MRAILSTILLSFALSVLAVSPTGLGLSNIATLASATPPASGGGDPHFASVTYLVNQAGTNGSTPSPAVVGGTITYTGNAAITTATAPLTYTSSLTLDGAGDVAWLASGNGSNLTGDFTVELFFKPSGTANNSRLIDISANKLAIFIDGAMSSATAKVFSADGGGYLYLGTSLGNIGTSTWRHIALSRTGSSVRLFFDGVQIGSTVTNSSTQGSNNANGVTLGSYFKGDANFYNGQIGPMRITKGVGRYSATFTPAAFPES